MNGFIIALVTLLFASGSEQPTGKDVAVSSPTIVTVDTIADVRLDYGETASVAVAITVADGYHVQANPAGEEFLIPLVLQLEPAEALAFGRIEYPEGVPYRLENSEDILRTYEGTFVVKVSLTALKAGALDVSGRVGYQACDSRRCLFPTSVPFAFKVIVEEKSSKGAGS